MLPSRLDPHGDRLAPSAMLGEAADSPERTVVLPLLHGPMGEDGTVQGMLELANVAYVGAGVLGSAVAMDKAMAKQVLSAAGIPQARYRAFAEHQITPGLPVELAAELGLPCFVKPANMGSSVGVSKAKTVEALRDAIDYALTYDEWIVVEEAVDGREIEVAVIGNNDPFVSVPGEIIPGDEFYSYDDKYVNDTSVGLVPASLDAGAGGRRARDGAARVPCAALRRARPLRLLLRGEGAGVPVQRSQHDARLHADLDVPQDADCERYDISRNHRSAGRARARPPRPSPPEHQTLMRRSVETTRRDRCAVCGSSMWRIRIRRRRARRSVGGHGRRARRHAARGRPHRRELHPPAATTTDLLDLLPKAADIGPLELGIPAIAAIRSMASEVSPDPTGPCGASVPAPTLEGAAGRTYDTVKGRITAIVVPRDATLDEYVEANRADLTEGCPSHTTTLPDGTELTLSAPTIVDVSATVPDGFAWVSTVEAPTAGARAT